MAATPRRIKLILAVGLVGLAIMLFAGAALLYIREQRRAEPITPPQAELRIAVDGSYAPFASADRDGALSGIDVEIGQALGEHLDMPVRFVNMGFDGLYDSLQSDQVDIVISTLIVEFWRTQDIRYTRAYFNAGLVLISDADNPVESMNEIPGKALAYEFGSEADSEVRLWSRRVAAFDVQPYELSDYALDAVRLGAADAALVDAVSAGLYLRAYPDWAVHSTYVRDIPYVIAVKYDRQDLWWVVDRTLGELLENGVIDAIIARWL